MEVRADRRSANELALFGGSKWFDSPKSTSNLVGPDFNRFLAYSRAIFDAAGQPPGVVTQQFEARLAAFHETEHCVAFCSGFWALATAIVALARPGRREVVIPSLTYRRMADVIAWTGLLPRFCEVDADTLAISAATAAPWINDDTALLLAVHPIINCCDAQGFCSTVSNPSTNGAWMGPARRAKSGRLGMRNASPCTQASSSTASRAVM
jgi:hypothetical protein